MNAVPWFALALFAAIFLAPPPAAAAEEKAAAGPFSLRGYYFILSRNPSYGLADYERIFDRMAEDRCNVVILWMAGGFPSRKYPETWDYNREHRNCRENFARAAIDAAHERGIRVALGFTPFAYDGVNRWGAAHPELGAVDETGKPAVTGGIHSFGRGLCPSKPAAREFMLGYCTELLDDFCPNADGFFIEHSDYGICRCADCSMDHGVLRREWELVVALSRRVWERKQDGLVLVYPQYAEAGVAYDPRHIVFVAPHNMRGADRIKNQKVLWRGYWEEGGFWKDFMRKASREKYAGVIPSMENFLYENPHAFDTRWGPQGVAGWDDLLVRITRLSFREYTARPDLDDISFRASVNREFFGGTAAADRVDELLTLHRLLNAWEGWSWRAGPVKVPEKAIDLDALDGPARDAWERNTLAPLRTLKAIQSRCEEALRSPGGPADGSPARRTLAEMAAIARWVIERWRGKLPVDTL